LVFYPLSDDLKDDLRLAHLLSFLFGIDGPKHVGVPTTDDRGCGSELVLFGRGSCRE
jgi:hypothetical protein